MPAKGSTGLSSYGGIFRDKSVAVLGCFAVNLGISYALHAELIDAMFAIELADKKVWHNLWLECDSQLVISAFNNINVVPWRNRWRNCLLLSRNMNFGFSHIYREGNSGTDKLASYDPLFRDFVGGT